jgi:non-specific serine/threonine protein kinase
VEAAGTTAYGGSLWAVGGLPNGVGVGGLKVVRIYDPKHDRWRNGPKLPVGLDHAPAATDREHLYVVGGWTGAGANRHVSRDVYRLDGPDDRSWAKVSPSLPEPRGAGALAWDGSRLVFAGGVGSDGQDHSEVWAFDGGEWTPIVPGLHKARNHVAAATDGRGTVWFLGGQDGSLKYPLDSVDVVHGQTVKPVTSFKIPKVRAPGAVWLRELGVCLFGGGTPDATEQVQCQRETPPLPNLPSPRGGVGAAVLDGAIYLVAGFDEHGRKLNRVDALQVYR